MNQVPASALLVAQLGSGESLERIARNLRLADRTEVSEAMARHGLTRQPLPSGVVLVTEHRGRD